MAINSQKKIEIDLNLPQSTTPLSMQWVEPGNFIIGNHYQESKLPNDFVLDELVLPIREVHMRITKGFWLGQFLVTQAQWEAIGNISITNKNIWKQNEEEKIWIDSPNYPVYGISWIEAMLFCRELNVLYKNKLPEGYHFSLPTELQWEYSCKAGLEKDLNTPSIGEFSEMYKPSHIQEVGQKKPNAWGFYDMIGNVREMCYDIAAEYADPYWEDEHSFPVVDDQILDWVGNKEPEYFIAVAKPIEERVVRGGYASTYREIKLLYKDLVPLVGLRICLRPIINWEYCDLNDPLLKKEGINMLG